MWNKIKKLIRKAKSAPQSQEQHVPESVHVVQEVKDSTNVTQVGFARDIINKINIIIPKAPLVVILIVLVLTIIGFALKPYVEHLLSCPAAMQSDFNIVVMRLLQYVDGTWQPTARANSISRFVAGYLEEEYQAIDFGLTVGVLYDDDCYTVLMDDDAAAVAQALNADIVIFGALDEGPHQSIFVVPRFYVAETEWQEDVGAVAGTYDILGFRIDCSQEDCLEEDILAPRAQILASFTEGLTYFATNDPTKLESPRRAFERAISLVERLVDMNPEALQDSRTRESLAIFYVMAARARRYLGDFDQAQGWIEQAFGYHPDYDRAYLERGNILYDLGRNVEPWDVELFDQAAEDYQMAVDHADELNDTNTLLGSLVNLGFTYVTLGHLAPPEQKAELIERGLPYFDMVIEAWQASESERDERRRGLAALAAYAQGIAYEQLGNLERAAEAYRNCVEWVVENENQREMCNTQLGIVTTAVTE